MSGIDPRVVLSPFPTFRPFSDKEKQRARDVSVTGSIRLGLGMYRTEEESREYYEKLRAVELP